MPAGTPEELDSFRLGSVQLQARAPEELKECVKATFKFFFYKNGPTIVQKGRVTPDPITLSFKFSGAGSLGAAQFLKQMMIVQEEIPLSWMTFAFKGYLTQFDFGYRQKEVNGTLTYQPIDLGDAKTAGSAAALGSTAVARPTLVEIGLPEATLAVRITFFEALFGDALNALGEAIEFLGGIKDQVQAAFDGLLDLLDQIDTFSDGVNAAVSAVLDIAAVPLQIAAQIQDTATNLLSVFTHVRDGVADLFSPTTPLLGLAAQFMMEAQIAVGLAEMDKMETALLLTRSAFTQQYVRYVFTDEDTLMTVAESFGLSAPDILAANPGLRPSDVQGGLNVSIPTGGTLTPSVLPGEGG